MSRTNSNMTIAKKAGICAFTLIFVVIGLAIMRGGIDNIQKAKSSLNWPQSNGKIIKSEVESDHDNDGTTWHAQITYTYTVDGNEMKGNQVAFGDYGSSNMSHAQGIVGRYPMGKEVKVYYNPKETTECLLEPGLHGQSYAMLGFGFAFFAVGSLFFILIIKTPIDTQNQTEPINLVDENIE